MFSSELWAQAPDQKGSVKTDNFLDVSISASQYLIHVEKNNNKMAYFFVKLLSTFKN